MKWIVALLACIGIAQAQIIQHNISDDGYVHVPLQFPFPFYGRTFTDSFMFSNGVIGFGSVNNHWCCSGYDLRYSQGYQFNFSIMALQTDLINYQGRFLTEGTTQYQRYMWENISEYGRPNNLNTFGVEIRPTGFIGMYYNQVNLDRPFTIGTTGNTTQGEYTQYRFENGLRTNQPFEYLIQGNICITNPLANPSCPNYQQAYDDYQCSLNPLYRPSCQGYEQAYFEQQCLSNPLYSNQCSGYEQAYILQNQRQQTLSTQTQVLVSTTGNISVETPIVADIRVNEVITNNARTPQPTPNNTVQNETIRQEKREEKKEEKKEVKKEIPKELKPEINTSAPQIISVQMPKSPEIIDLAYQRLIANVKPIRDNPRVRLMQSDSDIRHKELINEQWRR